MSGPSSTPNIAQYLGNDNNDGTYLGRAATSKIGMHGTTPVVQAAAIATPTDLATCIVAITAILVMLRARGDIAT